MILIGVIVGYLLGIAPFIYTKYENRKSNKVEEKNDISDKIVDEWLNGPKNINQEDVFNEYITGKEVSKGE